MKKMLFIAVAATALALGGCQSKREKEMAEDHSQATIDSLQRVIAQSKSESEDMAKTIQQIRDGFRQINEAEGRITKEQDEGSDQQVIVENMAFIQQTLRLNRSRIAYLQEQLRNANQTSKEAKDAYEAMVEEFNRQLESKTKEIEQLRQQLAEKDVQIAEQGEQISQLNQDVENLTSQNEEKARQMAEQDEKIHEAWYVFGTKKELREEHILEDGDVMRSANMNKDYFTKIDIRVTKKIPLYSKRAELKSDHPAGSYVLEKDAHGLYTLRITKPEAFWSASRYLVILVK